MRIFTFFVILLFFTVSQGLAQFKLTNPSTASNVSTSEKNKQEKLLITPEDSSQIKENQIKFKEYEPIKLGEMSFKDDENKEHPLEEFENKIVMLHFWATWCLPCQKEMPALDKFAKENRKNPLIVIPISEDYKEMTHIKEYYKTNSIANLKVYSDHKHNLMQFFAVSGLPTTVFLNKSGQEFARIEGSVEWQSPEVEKLMSDLLK